MDQGLKERLVGAAVLVAIAVWLIPWVLDGPEKNSIETGPASLQLPAAQEPVPMRTQTLKLGEPPAAAQPAATVTEKTEAPAETVVAAATPESTQPATTTAQASVAPPTTPAAPTPKPAAAETPRKPVAPPAAAATSTAKGDWTVQLGSFGDEGNARRLAERASTFGYKTNVASYKANGKTMYRVRVGAYGSRAQAEATASALSAHGLTARVVAAD